MYEGDVESILRCEQCNKPFDKQSTLKRHGYYCRSRKFGFANRSRSCTCCAKRKSRCDNRKPACSRCKVKGLDCHYPASIPRGAAPKPQQSIEEPIERQIVKSSVTGTSPGFGNGENDSVNDNIFDALVTPNLDFANAGGEYLDWGSPIIDFNNFLSPQTFDKTIADLSTESRPIFRNSAPSSNQIQPKQPLFSHNASVPSSPSFAVRSLIQRPKRPPGAQRIANLILHTLKSYPLMIMRHNSLPPFIHASLISSDVENESLEPLVNCISLVNMISNGVQARKLFWKNVRMECERLCAEHVRLDKWELLAAMQALSIYILIRMDEGETDHNNFDSLMLTTVTILSKQFAYDAVTFTTQSALLMPSLEGAWREWLFEESRRRLCVVYQITNMLVYFEPAAMCDHPTDLILAPLPAKKQLWEANDAFAWKTERDMEPQPQKDFGLAVNGELVRLNVGQEYCGDSMSLNKPANNWSPSGTTGNWEEWCAGMDGFGGLVMLAASLVV